MGAWYPRWGSLPGFFRPAGDMASALLIVRRCCIGLVTPPGLCKPLLLLKPPPSSTSADFRLGVSALGESSNLLATLFRKALDLVVLAWSVEPPSMLKSNAQLFRASEQKMDGNE